MHYQTVSLALEGQGWQNRARSSGGYQDSVRIPLGQEKGFGELGPMTLVLIPLGSHGLHHIIHPSIHSSFLAHNYCLQVGLLAG